MIARGQCAQITKKGKRCSLSTITTTYCKVHAPEFRCAKDDCIKTAARAGWFCGDHRNAAQPVLERLRISEWTECHSYSLDWNLEKRTSFFDALELLHLSYYKYLPEGDYTGSLVYYTCDSFLFDIAEKMTIEQVSELKFKFGIDTA